MLPGPTLIMKAPGCQKPVKFSTIVSGNTFRMTLWTDGKQHAPMLPDSPWLRKSPSEGVLFWSDECEEIGSINHLHGDHKSSQPEWQDLEFAEEPDEADYFRAIELGMGDTPKKLRYLRVRLWWAGNDAVREKRSSKVSDKRQKTIEEFVQMVYGDDCTKDNLEEDIQQLTSERNPKEKSWELSLEHLQNLEQLESMFSETRQSERLMRAEICRNLGKFEEAQRLLQFTFSKVYLHSAQKIAELCAKRDKMVARVVV